MQRIIPGAGRFFGPGRQGGAVRARLNSKTVTMRPLLPWTA